MSRTIRFTLNGEKVAAEIAPHQTLVEVLQQHFDLFGARESCAQGLCGCCTVLVNGSAVSGCLYLAAFIDGAEVVTVEHLAANGTLSPIQQAFIDCGAFQCGFCLSGMLFAAEDLLARDPSPSEQDIRAAISGNLCRCTGYDAIVAAIRQVAG